MPELSRENPGGGKWGGEGISSSSPGSMSIRIQTLGRFAVWLDDRESAGSSSNRSGLIPTSPNHRPNSWSYMVLTDHSIRPARPMWFSPGLSGSVCGGVVAALPRLHPHRCHSPVFHAGSTVPALPLEWQEPESALAPELQLVEGVGVVRVARFASGEDEPSGAVRVGQVHHMSLAGAVRGAEGRPGSAEGAHVHRVGPTYPGDSGPSEAEERPHHRDRGQGVVQGEGVGFTPGDVGVFGGRPGRIQR